MLSEARLFATLPSPLRYGTGEFTRIEGFALVPSELPPPQLTEDEKTQRFIYESGRLATRLSEPIEASARTCTDLAVFFWQHVIRKIDPHAKTVPLAPWEKFWQTQQEPNQPINLRGVCQNRLLERWISDHAFPNQVLQEADALCPGFKAIWQKKFSSFAAKQKYAPAQIALGGVLDGFINGLITGLPSEWQVAAGGSKLLLGLVTNNLLMSTYRGFNFLSAFSQTLPVELRTAFGRHAQENPPLNFDTTVNQIFKGSQEEFSFWLDSIQLWAMLGSLCLTRSALGLASKQKPTATDGLILLALGTAIIKGSRAISEKLLKTPGLKFGEIQRRITSLSQDQEDTARLTEQMVGDSSDLQTLAQQRDLVTWVKNLRSGAIKDLFPFVLTSLAANLSSQEITGLVFALSQITANATGRLNTLLNYLSTQATRKNARQNLLEAFRQLRLPITGRLTDEALRPWLEKNIDLAELPFVLEFKELGLIPYRRASDGVSVEAISFEPGFIVKRNDIIPILGSNSSGKSLLLAVLSGKRAGLLDQTKASWGNKDLRAIPADLHQRSWKIINAPEGQNLRKLLAAALFYKGQLRQTNLGFPLDQDRLIAWAKGNQNYPELETAVSQKLKDWGLSLHCGLSWHNPDFRPSGMQATLAAIAFHCFLDEPVNLLVDEAGGKLDTSHIQQFIDFLYTRSADGELPGAVFVAINSHLSLWWQKAPKAYINLREEVAGCVDSASSPLPHVAIRESLLQELNSLYESGEVMTPGQFADWITFGPGEALDHQLQKHLRCFDHAVTNENYSGQLYHPAAAERAVIDFENGPFAEYLQKCLFVWLEKTSQSQNPLAEAQNIAEALQVFYHREKGSPFSVFRPSSSQARLSPHNWNQSLMGLFDSVLNFYISICVDQINGDTSENGPSSHLNILHRWAFISQLSDFLNTYLDRDTTPLLRKSLTAIKPEKSPFGRVRTAFNRKPTSFSDLQKKVLDDPLVTSALFAEGINEFWQNNALNWFKTALAQASLSQVRDLKKWFHQQRTLRLSNHRNVPVTLDELAETEGFPRQIRDLIDQTELALLTA